MYNIALSKTFHLATFFISSTVLVAVRPEPDFNPYPANVEKYGELLIMPANGRWDLTWRL